MLIVLLSGVLCMGIIVLAESDHWDCQSSSSKEADHVRQLSKTRQELSEIRERAFQSFTRLYA